MRAKADKETRKALLHTGFYWQKESEREKFVEVCRRLNLTQSEVARRAVRLGLPKLRDLELPGSGDEEDNEE